MHPYKPRSSYTLADILFLSLSLVFSIAACKGTLLLSPLGCGIDTDLQNYAQIIEVAKTPQAFIADPVAPLFPLDPGVPNLLTSIASLFTGAPNAAVAILYAGTIGLWLQLVSWYALGRVLWQRASLAVILSLACSITFYWAYGTFWGATHAEPVPRIFYNSCLPLFLILALFARESIRLRLLLSLLLGLSIFVHSVSALMAGAMFMTAFFLLPIKGSNSRVHLECHIGQCVSCLIVYLVPVAYFVQLRVPITQPENQDMTLLMQVFNLRFHHNWNDIWEALGDKLILYSIKIPIIPLGLLSLLILTLAYKSLPERIRTFVPLVPALLCGILAGCIACLIEMQLAQYLQRQALSAEMLRGTRFIIPLCLLSASCALFIVWDKLPKKLTLILALAGAIALLSFSHDKQIRAARTYVATTLGMPVESRAQAEMHKNRLELEAMQAISQIVPQNETVFAPEDTMAVRYVAHKALQAVHKDGNIIYYARDLRLAKKWFSEQQRLLTEPSAILEVFVASQARWLIVRQSSVYAANLSPLSLQQYSLRTVYHNTDWLLIAKE